MTQASRSPFVLRETTLANGLRVQIHEDHAAPIVAVNLWYHVGSKNEKPGRTGFAHLFEHLLFQGSEHVGRDQHFGLIQQRGGTANGSTWYDRTNYHETLPARELELALWLESDRMGFFLPSITQEKLDNQRDVVKNERRFRVDNQPYGTWMEKGFELLFPAGHPYHWPVIGYMPDLDAASLDDVRDFFRTFYLPNNAVLSIVGDVDAAAAEALVRRYFEGIPAGPAIPAVDCRLTPRSRESRLVIEDNVQLPKLFQMWTIPPYGTPGYYALDFLSDLLSAGKASRLYRSLVHERELAKDVSAFTFNTEEIGTLMVVATPRPGVEIARLEEALDRELGRARVEAAGKEEMARTLNRIETAFIGRLESAEHKADLLSMYATYFNDPHRIETEIDHYRRMRPEEIQRAAAAHLNPEQRVQLTYVPARATASVAVGAGPVLERAQVPVSGPERSYRFPRPERARLKNGMRVVISRMPKIPLVSATALVDAGAARDPQGKQGLAALTGSLLDEGTSHRTSQQISDAIEMLGAHLGAGGELDSAYVGVSGLSRNFPEAFAIAGEVLTQPSFPEREFDRLRAEHLAQIQENRSSPGSVADDVLEQALYGTHPYAHPLLGTEASLSALNSADVRGFAKAHLRPESTVLVVAGDVDPAAMMTLADQTFGAWPGGGTVPAPLPTPTAGGGRRILLVNRPGSAQSELRLANMGIPRASDDFVACEVLNGILGGKFTSRLNLNLREEHGYTYGARSGFSGRRSTGPFQVSTAVQSEVTLPALDEIFKELDRIRDAEVSTKELDETRSYIEGVFPLTVETAGEVAGRLAEIELYGLSDDYFDLYPGRISAVTAAEVQRLAQKHIRPEEMVVVVVGSGDGLRKGLEKLGDVVEIDDDGKPLS